MANRADFNIQFNADRKELDRALKDIAKQAKEAKKRFTKQVKQERKHNRARKRELEYQTRLEVGRLKDRKKHIADIRKAEKRGWDEEKVHNRRMFREKQRYQKETTRWRKREEREIKKGPMRQRFRGAAGRAGRAATGLAGGLAGFFMGGAVAAYQKHVGAEKARASLAGLVDPGGYGTVHAQGWGGTALGYNVMDSIRQQKMMARATGTTSPREMQQWMRSTGMEEGETAGLFGAIRRAGYSFDQQGSGSSQGVKKLEKIFSIAMYTGLERARFPEFAKGVMTLTKQTGALVSGKVDPLAMAKMIGMVQKALPGMEGERAVGVTQQLHGVLTKPGGGEWGKGLVMRAMGFGVPGSGTSWYEAEKMREKGLSDPKNLQRLLGRVGKEHGFGEEGAVALRAMAPGMGLQVAEDLLKGFKGGKLDPKLMAKAIRKTKPIEEQSKEIMEEMGGDIKHLAEMHNEWTTQGKDFRKEIQALQKLQLDLFRGLSAIVKEVIPLLKSMAEGIQDLVDISEGDKNLGAPGANAAEQERQRLWQKRTQAKSWEEVAQIDTQIAEANRAWYEKSKTPTGTGLKSWGKAALQISGIKDYGPSKAMKEDALAEEARLLESARRARSAARFTEIMKNRGVTVDPSEIPIDKKTGFAVDMYKMANMKRVIEEKIDRLAEAAIDRDYTKDEKELFIKLYNVLHDLEDAIRESGASNMEMRGQDARQPVNKPRK